MRHALAFLLVAVIAVVLGAVALIYAGVYDVAATTPHWPAARAILETARLRSIKAHSAGIAVPPGLDDPAKVLIGVDHSRLIARSAMVRPVCPKAISRVAFIRRLRIWPKRRHSTLPQSSSGSSNTASK